MDGLLRHNRDFVGCVKRNIVAVVPDPFGDLVDDPADANIAAALADSAGPRTGQAALIAEGFAYSAAIAYPFATDHWMASRYSDGSFPAWYGALTLETTIHETAYHMLRHEMGVEGFYEGQLIRRRRHVYDVDCRALLIDLVGQEKTYPDLVSKTSYALTQQLGRRLSEEGHPGLLAPSARHASGTSVVAFQPRILSNPRLSLELMYTLDASTREITVEGQGGFEAIRIAPEIA